MVIRVIRYLVTYVQFLTLAGLILGSLLLFPVVSYATSWQLSGQDIFYYEYDSKPYFFNRSSVTPTHSFVSLPFFSHPVQEYSIFIFQVSAFNWDNTIANVLINVFSSGFIVNTPFVENKLGYFVIETKTNNRSTQRFVISTHSLINDTSLNNPTVAISNFPVATGSTVAISNFPTTQAVSGDWSTNAYSTVAVSNFPTQSVSSGGFSTVGISNFPEFQKVNLHEISTSANSGLFKDMQTPIVGAGIAGSFLGVLLLLKRFL